MELLLILAQTRQASTESAAFGLGQVIFYGALAFLLVLTVVSTRIVMECVRKKYVSPLIMAPVLYGTSLGPFLLILLTLGGVLPESDGVFYAFLLSPALWILALVVYTFVSEPKKRAEVAAENERLGALYSDLDAPVGTAAVNPQPPAADEFTVDDVVDAEPEPTPRRAVTLPAADSDDGPGGASQQTLKRMSLEEVEQKAAKGPRAGEVPGNPILPDEVVKIRCLACDKKMKAEGSKFMKQRRCPACKAEPFRYVTAV
ncbi:MAG: hypothetical protein H6841_01635 [Planctomycetes bacterium]|nr:hypothetical protein [Planctomycetota bacterium]MCB9935536.1 hypothetical protein [Planctomycetota bacterium]